MPDIILQKTSLTGREKMWEKIFEDERQLNNCWVAESSVDGVIGFVTICEGWEKQYPGYGEIVGLYLLKKHQSKGVGAKLLLTGLKELYKRGFKSVYLWVLKNNPTEGFYQKMDGKQDGEKVEDMYGEKITEVFYIWPNMKNLLV